MALGAASALFVASFTWWVCQGQGATPDGRQSPRQALTEVWFGILVGLALNTALNWVFLPMLGATLTMADNLALGAIYTAVSIVRGYLIRRWSEARLHRAARRPS